MLYFATVSVRVRRKLPTHLVTVKNWPELPLAEYLKHPAKLKKAHNTASLISFTHIKCSKACFNKVPFGCKGFANSTDRVTSMPTGTRKYIRGWSWFVGFFFNSHVWVFQESCLTLRLQHTHTTLVKKIKWKNTKLAWWANKRFVVLVSPALRCHERSEVASRGHQFGGQPGPFMKTTKLV